MHAAGPSILFGPDFQEPRAPASGAHGAGRTLFHTFFRQFFASESVTSDVQLRQTIRLDPRVSDRTLAHLDHPDLSALRVGGHPRGALSRHRTARRHPRDGSESCCSFRTRWSPSGSSPSSFGTLSASTGATPWCSGRFRCPSGDRRRRQAGGARRLSAAGGRPGDASQRLPLRDGNVRSAGRAHVHYPPGRASGGDGWRRGVHLCGDRRVSRRGGDPGRRARGVGDRPADAVSVRRADPQLRDSHTGGVEDPARALVNPTVTGWLPSSWFLSDSSNASAARLVRKLVPLATRALIALSIAVAAAMARLRGDVPAADAAGVDSAGEAWIDRRRHADPASRAGPGEVATRRRARPRTSSS